MRKNNEVFFRQGKLLKIAGYAELETILRDSVAGEANISLFEGVQNQLGGGKPGGSAVKRRVLLELGRRSLLEALEQRG